MNVAADKMQVALTAYVSRDFAGAEQLCNAIVKHNPNHFDAFHLLGAAQWALGKGDAALASYRRAISLRPRDANALTDHGVALQGLGRLDDALASYDRALAVQPENVTALNNRGTTLQHLKRFEEALESFDRALILDPEFADAYFNRGVVLQNLGRDEEALASLDRALTFVPNDVEALNNKGNVLLTLKRPGEALAIFDGAIAIFPSYSKAWSNRGAALKALNRLDDALASFDRALQIQPDYVQALNNRGNTLQEMHRYGEALINYDRALALSADYVDAHFNRGTCLSAIGRLEEALAGFERTLFIEPEHDSALSEAAGCAAKLCDFARYEKFGQQLRAAAGEGRPGVSPFILLNYSQDESLHLSVAREYWARHFGSGSQHYTRNKGCNEKIRIAYLSPDFRPHPVAQAIAELFECHDKSRFDIIGLSFGPNDRSDIRDRIAASLSGFHDVERKSDHEIAEMLRDRQVDIAVDLCGYTTHSRPGIFALRPAPVQVSYLGYAATMGSDCIDYIVADAVALPLERQDHYAERIVHLPGCYLANSRQALGASPPARSEFGLPEHAFVFCCFNNSWKITPAMFDTWMQILGERENSVLWLSSTSDTAVRNLRGAAEARGVNPSRLVFATRLARLEDHLARHSLADLFLGTIPYNGHTTACQALWAGLPVLACKGGSFVGRVASSLLTSVGLDEMITSDLDQYKALALKLAGDPVMLANIRSKLVRNRDTHPLFDTQGLARHIESAYTTMWEACARGEKPKSFAVRA